MLENLAGPGGVLSREAPDAKEFDGLVRSGLARLRDAESAANSLESRFDLAYNAAHSFALAALRFHGCRSENRYLVFQVLRQTVELSPSAWRVLDKAHSTRNRAEYEGYLDHDTSLLESVIRGARDVEQRLVALRKRSP